MPIIGGLESQGLAACSRNSPTLLQPASGKMPAAAMARGRRHDGRLSLAARPRPGGH